jgi:hypothetical protein
MVGQNAVKAAETKKNAGNQPDFCLVKEMSAFGYAHTSSKTVFSRRILGDCRDCIKILFSTSETSPTLLTPLNMNKEICSEI